MVDDFSALFDPLRFADSIAEVSHALNDIRSNLDYIRQELPSLELPDDVRQELEALLYDFSHDISERQDILGNFSRLTRRIENEAIEPSSKTPKEFVHTLLHWSTLEFHDLHRLITKLQSRTKESTSLQALYVLVAESGTNILHAYSAMQKALEAMDTQMK